MLEVGAPTLIGLGSGIIAILVVLGTLAAAGMYAFGRRSGWNAAHYQVCSQLLPLLSTRSILRSIHELESTDMAKPLRKALDYEIVRRNST